MATGIGIKRIRPLAWRQIAAAGTIFVCGGFFLAVACNLMFGEVG
jgi:hypothetical protein